MKAPQRGRHAADLDGTRPLSKAEAALLDELNALLASPRAEEILLNDWLHDGDLSIPSVELIQHVAYRLLMGHGITLEVSTLARNETAAAIISAFRNESPEEREAAVKRASRSLACYRFLTTGKSSSHSKHSPEWLPILSAFWYPQDDPAGNEFAAGQRALARGILETLMLRAVFHFDTRRLEALAEVVRNAKQGKEVKPTRANHFAGEILRWLPDLSDALEGRRPTQAEMEHFIMTWNEDDLPNNREAWTKAFKLVGWPADSKRSAKIDRDKITGLARTLKRHP